MAARRVRAPDPVAVLSVAGTGHGPTDRVLIQVQEAAQELQRKVRDGVTGINQAQAAADAASAAAAAVPTTGRLLAAPALLTGSGSGTLPAGTCVVVLDMIGQGGGGGGAVNGSAVASGGLSGWRFRISIGTPGVPLSTLAYSWSAGSAAGAGGSAAGANGQAGSDTTATVNATGYTAKGGAGGIGSTGSGAVGSTAIPAAAGGTSSGGVAAYGQSGPGQVMALTTAGLVGGGGGGTDLGTGGHPIVGAASNGNAASTAGYGGGGGGAVAINAVGFVGGAGAPGVVMLTPYS